VHVKGRVSCCRKQVVVNDAGAAADTTWLLLLLLPAAFWMPYIGHTWHFPAWNPQAHSVENRVKLWEGVKGVLEQATGESLPDLETKFVPGGSKAPWGAAAEAAAQGMDSASVQG
jgi:hypothetical protein